MEEPGTQTLRWRLAGAVVEASLSVQASINTLSVGERSKRTPSPLKPFPPETSALVDAVGEEAAFQKLKLLAQEIGIEVRKERRKKRA
eukprot:scaffold93321_cov21-Tisochrysis_lutea.AAC.1